LQKPEIELAEQFIKQLTAGFAPEQYKDEYQDRVLALVETKRAGQVIAGQPQKAKLAPVIDLMEALKKSIADRGAPAAAAAAPTLVEPAKKKAPKSAAVTESKPARGRKTG
jgi:DNA end-binding protein Ku